MTDAFSRLCATLGKTAMAVAGLCLVIITAVISWQVFARYILNNSPSWTEQAALLVLIWMIFIGGAAGVHQDFHLRLSLVEDQLPEPWRKRLRIGTQLLVMAFGILMAICGVGLAIATAQHELPALGVSRAFAYVPVAISGTLIGLFALDRAIRIGLGQEVASAWN